MCDYYYATSDEWRREQGCCYHHRRLSYYCCCYYHHGGEGVSVRDGRARREESGVFEEKAGEGFCFLRRHTRPSVVAPPNSRSEEAEASLPQPHRRREEPRSSRQRDSPARSSRASLSGCLVVSQPRLKASLSRSQPPFSSLPFPSLCSSWL